MRYERRELRETRLPSNGNFSFLSPVYIYIFATFRLVARDSLNLSLFYLRPRRTASPTIIAFETFSTNVIIAGEKKNSRPSDAYFRRFIPHTIRSYFTFVILLVQTIETYAFYTRRICVIRLRCYVDISINKIRYTIKPPFGVWFKEDRRL